MDLFVEINDIEKSVVKQHTKKTKSGKLAIVKQHTNKVVKKNKVKNPWIEKYGKYQLNGYPTPDIKGVEVNLKGDIHSHAVLTWYDPKTGNKKHVYTKQFMDRNKEVKWQRLSKLDSKLISEIKKKTIEQVKGKNLNSKLYSGRMRELAAVVNIIANTGLRVGTYQLFRQTGNRGVTTLTPDQVTINKDVVSFNFIGKSYQENTAKIKDKNLAVYLIKLKNEKKGKEFLFDTEYKMVHNYFHKTLGIDKDVKIKDMRTYVATDLARSIMFKQTLDLSSFKSKTKLKKHLKEVIKSTSEQVAKKLNNTPSIAKASYIHPNIQSAWLNTLDIDPELKKHFQKASNELSLDTIIKMYPPSKKKYNIDEQDEELCDEYNLLDWLNETEEELNKGIKNMELYIIDPDIEKSVVKQHTKKTKSGKMVNVKQYINKKKKLTLEQKQDIRFEIRKLKNKIKEIKKRKSLGQGDDINNNLSISQYRYEVKELKEKLKGNTEKSNEDEIGLFVSDVNLIEKSQVKAHARTSKSGKMEQVKAYTDKRQKKNAPMSSGRGGSGAGQQQMKVSQQQGQQVQGQDGMEEPHPAAKLQKKVKHLDFMAKNYPDVIDKKKLLAKKKDLKEKIRKVEDIVDDDEEINPHPPNWNGEDEKEYRGDNDRGEKITEKFENLFSGKDRETQKKIRSSKEYQDYHKIWNVSKAGKAKFGSQKDYENAVLDAREKVVNKYSPVSKEKTKKIKEKVQAKEKSKKIKEKVKQNAKGFKKLMKTKQKGNEKQIKYLNEHLRTHNIRGVTQNKDGSFSFNGEPGSIKLEQMSKQALTKFRGYTKREKNESANLKDVAKAKKALQEFDKKSSSKK